VVSFFGILLDSGKELALKVNRQAAGRAANGGKSKAR
jgi:hypothetical protein